MTHTQEFSFDREWLRRCKYSTPEQKLEWIEAAVEFAYAKKTRVTEEHGEKQSQ